MNEEFITQTKRKRGKSVIPSGTERQHSKDKYKFYRSIYPVPKKVNRNISKMMHPNLKKQFTECFDLVQLNDVFLDAISAAKAQIDNKEPFTIPTQTFAYNHDKIVYCGTLFTSLHIDIAMFNIKLSNNGFVYTDKFKAVSNYISRHYSEYWYEIDIKYLDDIADILEYAVELLGTSIINVKLYYNQVEERMDIKFFNNGNSNSDNAKRCVVVTFEPGYPEVDFSQDTWVSIDANEILNRRKKN